MSGPGAPPPPPDPVATAKAQADTNKQTAVTQFGLNAVNQNTPQGSSSYKQIGTWADGTPRYQQDTTLAPEQQKLYDQQTQLGSGVNNLAIGQVNKLSGLLDKPVDLSNQATEGRLFDLGRKRLDPQFARDWDARETTLMNRGIDPGSEGYNREQQAFDQRKNDAYNQLALTGRGQSVQEALTERNQPINEITALMSGGQVSMPHFGSTPQSSVASPDIAGLTMDAYRMGPLAQYQAGVSQNNAMMGGLFGLGGAALGGWGMGGFKNPFGTAKAA